MFRQLFLSIIKPLALALWRHFDILWGPKREECYQWHTAWHLTLLRRRLRRWWQYFELRAFLLKHRWFWLLLAGLASAAFAGRLLTGEWWALNPACASGGAACTSLLDKLADKPTAWTLLTAIISAPIAFVLWWFRDTNALWQIENQRKDINLKDFQRLAELASGLHLVEDKASTSEKFTGSKAEEPSERNISTERSQAPADATTPTRREGSVALQVAAVYQLQAFLRGDYGRHFQEPAFALLKSIWQSLVQSHLAAWQPEFAQALALRLDEIKREEADTKALLSDYDNWKAILQKAATQSALA
jgi:hypothetical protein